MEKTQQITLTLSLDHMNVIASALGKMPLESVIGTFEEIKKQVAQSQIKKTAEE